MDDYDVFLNRRGPDVKAGFVAHLEEALRQAGLNPFLDKKSLVQGNSASGGIDAALEVARVHVAVVSRGYAESKHCLNELVAMLKSSKPVIRVFYDVEPAELRRVEKGQFATAFKKHKSRETVERVQEWVDALCKLADITGFCFRLSDYEGDEAELKRKVVDAILSLLPAHVALQVESHFVGLEEHVETCVNKLKQMSNGTSFLCLVGMGGIGKTSLAKEVYNHMRTHGKFRGMSFLEIGCNSPTSLEVGSNLMKRMREQLLWDLLHIGASNQLRSYEYWFPKISSCGRVLIVLDDIHDKDQFDKLIRDTSVLPSGSCIIVTSRDQHLLRLIAGKCNFYLHEVALLGDEESQRLFNWHAFGDEEAPHNFKVVANDVSKACGGLPLALKVVGSSLFCKTSDEDLKYIWPEAKEALIGDPSVTKALRWSYDQLSESEKVMFVDIACVFCGWTKRQAIEIWQSCKMCSSCCGHGTPYTSLQHLIDKSLIVLTKYEDEEHVLRMHALLQDMGQDIGEVEGSHVWKGKAMKAITQENQNSNKVRAMNLAKFSEGHVFDAQNFAKIPNLHFLILDGCDVSGNFGSISNELRYLQWRNMPLVHVPPTLNLSNVTSLDFSNSTKLATIWMESAPNWECCPKLRKLNLLKCTSITTLPDSIGRLSSLQELNLNYCGKLQKLPNSIDQLTALEKIFLSECESLEALPNSITSLSRLQKLQLDECSSASMPGTFGSMTRLSDLTINLATEGQVVDIGQLNALQELLVKGATDEMIALLDSSGAITNLHQLSELRFHECTSVTKLPETIGWLTNLDYLFLWRCERVRELPNSIGQLQVLTRLHLRYCISLETLPDSLGALTRLEDLCIVNCTAITELPTSIGHLSSLETLHLWGCGELQSLPDSLSQLNALQRLEILDCGSSLEGLGLRRALQGLRIWGCTSITELPESCLVVVDSNLESPEWIWDGEDFWWTQPVLEEVEEVEANDCGLLCRVRDLKSGRTILRRVHDSPCCELTPVRHSPSPGGDISSDDHSRSAAMSSMGESDEEEDTSAGSWMPSGLASGSGRGDGTHPVLWAVGVAIRHILCCIMGRPRSPSHFPSEDDTGSQFFLSKWYS